MLSLPVALARLGAVSFFCADDHVYVGCSLLGLADEIDVPGGDSFFDVYGDVTGLGGIDGFLGGVLGHQWSSSSKQESDNKRN